MRREIRVTVELVLVRTPLLLPPYRLIEEGDSARTRGAYKTWPRNESFTINSMETIKADTAFMGEMAHKNTLCLAHRAPWKKRVIVEIPRNHFPSRDPWALSMKATH